MIAPKSKPEVSICKVVLWKQLNSNSDLNHLVNEEIQIKSRLVDAFDRRVSTSILVVGPTGSGKRELVEKVMIDYCTEGLHNSRPVSVARINGLVHLNDNQAIISLADQLLLRPSSYDRNVNIANEDLENHFRQCRFDSQPAVIIVEELQEFSKREKQVLIYTLLDLMHREDLLFVMIGTTKSADVNYLLEKRVLSRFSAQFVYIPPSIASDICIALSKRLTLPSDFGGQCSGEKKSTTSSTKIDRGSSASSRYSSYRNRFNAQIVSCFGPIPKDPQGNSYSRAVPGPNKIEDDTSESDEEDENGARKECESTGAVRGSLYDDILFCVENGSSLKHFFKAAQMAVTMLSSEADVLTAQMFRDCLYRLERPSLALRLSGLSELELNLAAAIGRVRMRTSGFKGSMSSTTATSSSSSARGEGSKGTNGRNKVSKTITVEDAMNEFHRLSSIVTRKMLPEESVRQAFLSLVKSGIIVLSNGFEEGAPRDLVTAHSAIEFLPAEHEFEAAFKKGFIADSSTGAGAGAGAGGGIASAAGSDRGSSSSSSSSSSAGHQRSEPTLRVSNRVRRAVLNPHEQVLMEGSVATM